MRKVFVEPPLALPGSAKYQFRTVFTTMFVIVKAVSQKLYFKVDCINMCEDKTCLKKNRITIKDNKECMFR